MYIDNKTYKYLEGIFNSFLQKLNISVISITLSVFHFEILGKDANDLQL